MSLVCPEQDGSPLLDDLIGFPVMDHLRCQQTKSAVVMFYVILQQELTAEQPGILDATEPFWKIGAILHRLQL